MANKKNIMRSWERNCWGKEKSSHFSAFNDTFFCFLNNGPALLLCTRSHVSRSWLCSQIFISFNPWQCPREKFLNLPIFFCALEISRSYSFPLSANVTGIQSPLGSSGERHLAGWGKAHRPLPLFPDPGPESFLSWGGGGTQRLWRECPQPVFRLSASAVHW